MKKKTNKGIVLIKKSNNLIESRYKFDIWETRFFLSVLGQIRRDDDGFEVYRIWYKDVIKTFGLKSGDSYSLLRNAAQSLMGKSFFVSYEKDGAQREQQYHILRKIDYLQEGQSGEQQEYIDVTVEEEMRPFLLELQKNFTAYDLRNIVQLGVYPVRVYELLKQYERIGHRKLKVVDMKKMFEVTDKYRAFGDFFRWVIKPAIKEINQYTDLTITDVEKIKEGRSVVALRFRFKGKKDKELAEVHGEKKNEQLDLDFSTAKKVLEVKSKEPMTETAKDQLFNQFQEDVVQRFGVTPSAFLKLLGKYDEVEIEQAIRVTNRAKFQNQIKSSTAGFFINALKNAYTDEKEELQKKEQKLKAAKLKAVQLQKAVQELKSEKSIVINQKIKQITTEKPMITNQAIEALRNSSMAKIIIDKREEVLGRTLIVEDFREDKLLRELVKGKIVELEKKQFLSIENLFEQRMKRLKKANK